MKYLKVFLFFILILGLLFSGRKIIWRYFTKPAIVTNPDFKNYEILIDGKLRRYFVQVPGNTEKKWPVLIGFHGGIGRGLSFEGRSKLGKPLKEDDVLYVLPEGYNSYWNDGAGGTRQDNSVDDVKFISKLISDLSLNFPIDPKRIFLAGYSRGGSFVFRLSCEISSVLAGAIVVGASMPPLLSEKCEMQNPIPLLYIHGTLDPASPFGGGESGINWPIAGHQGGKAIGFDASLNLWRKKLGCQSQQVTLIPPLVTDGTKVKRIYESDCFQKSFIEAYVVEGMGHVWPPFKRNFGFIMGSTSKNLNTNELVRNFIQIRR